MVVVANFHRAYKAVWVILPVLPIQYSTTEPKFQDPLPPLPKWNQASVMAINYTSSRMLYVSWVSIDLNLTSRVFFRALTIPPSPKIKATYAGFSTWKVSPLLGLLIKSYVSMYGVREGGEMKGSGWKVGQYYFCNTIILQQGHPSNAKLASVKLKLQGQL